MVENIFLTCWGIAVGILIALYVRELFELAKPPETPKAPAPYVDPDDDFDATGGWRGTSTINYTGSMDDDPDDDFDATGGWRGTSTINYTGSMDDDPFEPQHGGWNGTGLPQHSDPYHDLDDCIGGSWTDADLSDDFYDEEDDDV